MSKILPKNFQNTDVLFQNLGKLGASMLSGDVVLRQALEVIEPYTGDRRAWFSRVARRVGLKANRVRSLFYNRGCRLWSNELTAIYGVMNDIAVTQNVKFVRALNQSQKDHVQSVHIEAIKGEIRGEILEDIRALLLELRGSGDGFSIRGNGAALSRG